MTEYDIYKNLTKLREPLIEKIINSLNLKSGSKGIDIGCGIGQITDLLSKNIGPNGEIIGLDYSAGIIDYANKHSKKDNVEFLQGDINNLYLKYDSFDWVWSMDTVWAGPQEFGCPAEEPDNILNQLYRILKPGGIIYLLFWTSQKFLPGYPLLEARLNASTSANAPYINNMNPYNHIMNGKKWLTNARFDEIRVNSFVGDIVGPINENDKKALASFFQMLWGNSSHEVSKDDWQKFNEICLPGSNQFILDNPDYYGYFTYTLFKGRKKQII